MSAKFIKELDEFRHQLDELKHRGSDLEWLRTERRLRLQYVVTRVLAESASLAEAAPRLLQSMCIIEGWHFGNLWQADPGRSRLDIQGYWHSPSLDATDLVLQSRKARFGRGNDIPGGVWANGKAIWIPELGGVSNSALAPAAVRAGLHSHLAFPVRGAGRVIGVIGLYSRDIRKPDPDLLEMADALGRQVGDFIERKAVERELVEHERLFRALIEHSSDAIRLFSAEGKIIYATPSAERVLGYTPEELIGRDASEFVHPEEERHLRGLMKQSIAQPGNPVKADYRFRHKDGSWLWVESRATNLLDQPSVRAIVVNTRDITDRKDAQAREEESLIREELARNKAERTQERISFLEEASKLLSASLDDANTLSGIAALAVPVIADWCVIDILEEPDSFRRVAVAHKEAAKASLVGKLKGPYPLGLDLQEKVLNKLKSGKGQLYKEISEAMLRSTPGNGGHAEILRELGMASLMIVPMSARGRMIGAITLVRSGNGHSYGEEELSVAQELARGAALAIENAGLYQESQTMNAQLEQRVAERTTQLEAANKELEAFTYSVSHDLRAPLRAVVGFSRVLLEDHSTHLDAEGKRLLGIVRDGALRMGELIDDLLAFSRIGRLQLRHAPINMTELAASVAEEVKALEPERNVLVTIKPMPSLPGDAHLMRQVFMNLLSNAFKFTANQPEACVEVGARVEGDELIYYVRDNGIGFDMRYGNKLFGVFQRLHSGEEFEGTGVGLAIVKRIVNRHQGRVWAEAKVNGGATFYFSFPR